MTIAGHHETCGICHTAGPCEHMLDELAAALEAANAQVTFDRGRNNTHPCTFCARIPERYGVSAFELVTIGRYLNGEALTRPVCAECQKISGARWATKEGSDAQSGNTK